MEQRSVLIIEDEEFLAGVMEKKLEIEGLKIDVTSNGEEGLKMVNGGGYDLLLVDLLLPKMMGTDIIEQVRDNPDKAIASTPIMVITNYPYPKYHTKCRELGVDDFVVKADVSADEIIRRALMLLK